MKRRLLAAVLATACLFAAGVLITLLRDDPTRNKTEGRVQINVLILPKFEIGQMTGDAAGEAQYYFEEYVLGGEEYEIAGANKNCRLYVKDGIALYLTGMGKVDSALNTAMLLSDDRFDFSKAYVLSTGCAGSAAGYGTMGDVFVLTATVDYDLGHHADPRDMKVMTDETWFSENDHDELSVVKLNPAFTGRVYDLVKNVKLETTEKTKAFLAKEFPGEAWANREPQVLRGTGVTGDNFWKGRYDHKNALKKVATYGCEDPFATTEMEDMAVVKTLQRFGLLDRSVVIRDSVNLDVFMNGDYPELMWDSSFEERATGDESGETLDIFDTAMRNNFKVGKTIIDAILRGEL